MLSFAQILGDHYALASEQNVEDGDKNNTDVIITMNNFGLYLWRHNWFDDPNDENASYVSDGELEPIKGIPMSLNMGLPMQAYYDIAEAWLGRMEFPRDLGQVEDDERHYTGGGQEFRNYVKDPPQFVQRIIDRAFDELREEYSDGSSSEEDEGHADVSDELPNLKKLIEQEC